MTTLLTGMAGMAVLFLWFGVFALGDRSRGCHGDCGTCAADCEYDLEGSGT
jgi:hypothetical protein